MVGRAGRKLSSQSALAACNTDRAVDFVTTDNVGRVSDMDQTVQPGMLHHIELWAPDFDAACPRWQWLLGALGYTRYQSWEAGASYRLGPTYIVLEQSPALVGSAHERRRPGLNHLAFHAGGRDAVDQLVEDAASHGWNLMFADQHPFAGGPDHYAAYLEDEDGYEVELVAAG